LFTYVSVYVFSASLNKSFKRKKNLQRLAKWVANHLNMSFLVIGAASRASSHDHTMETMQKTFGG